QCNVVNGTAACQPAECFPGTTQCKSATVQQLCSPQGKWQDSACSSQPNMGPLAECLGGTCVDECADAAAQKSYFGCEYWSAVQDNAIGSFFTGLTGSARQGTAPSLFAFVAANRSAQAATLNVTRWMNGAEQVAATVTVPPRTDPQTRGLAVAYVPWQSVGASSASSASSTGKERFGYRVTSSRPVALYQFNPLDSVKAGTLSCTAPEGATDTGCTENATTGVCRTVNGSKRCRYYTYSNDASLLLPLHILGTSYVAVAPSHVKSRSPKLFGGWKESNIYNTHLTVVASADNTQVTLSTRAKLVSGGGVSVPVKGGQQVYTLNRYDVLQVATDNDSNIQCTADPGSFWGDEELCRVNNDLSGSLVTASAPVAVFGGSGCSFVPYSSYACDHLEEQVFPFSSWGKSFVATRSHPLRVSNTAFASPANAAPDYYKIVASCPASQCPSGTTVLLSGAASQYTVLTSGTGNGCIAGTALGNAAAPCRLMGSAFVEFSSKASFTVETDQPVAVAQFFAGQGATAGSPDQGDPSMILLPPSEQWRSGYTLLAAPGIRDNYLGLAIDDTKVQEVRVDGAPVTGFTAVGTTPFKVLNAPVSEGTHTIEVVAKPGQPASGAGVTVYGFDSYVSYGYAGGLDLKSIVVGVNPGG
ncbi:MAG: IgGFc-binding protein, partial [Deltaproteobacteria bacterium]|nr:IgGFc-binding protein [Deltaproteobacteria bacterium]